MPDCKFLKVCRCNRRTVSSCVKTAVGIVRRWHVVPLKGKSDIRIRSAAGTSRAMQGLRFAVSDSLSNLRKYNINIKSFEFK